MMSKKIKPIYNSTMSLKLKEVKDRILEARVSEDSDLMIIAEEFEEIIPICKIEQELRDYIKSAEIKRKLTHLVVHCTATQPTATVTAIQNYWKNVRGWKSPGYHIILPQEGFTVLSDFNSITNGALGYNERGVHISYIGGIDKSGKAKDTRTDMQSKLIEIFIEEMVERFPHIKVIGHQEVAAKSCPSFKVKDEYPTYWTGL